MSRFPKSLQPWEEQLSLLSTDAIAVLSSWLKKLSAWIGPYPTLLPHDSGDPSGFGDLSRRGNYEHLLTAEWLLADEFPEEFLRRASEKEHIFYRLMRLENKINKECFIFFDCGPLQLGKPRLVQLALLIVLYRRAMNSKVSFCWTVMQYPDKTKNTLYEEDMQFFLSSRSMITVDSEFFNRCMDNLRDNRSVEGFEKEVWVVGSEETAKNAVKAGCLHVSIRELIAGLDDDSATDRLYLQLGGPVHRSRNLTLDAPAESICVGLLRRPFSDKLTTPVSKTGLITGESDGLDPDIKPFFNCMNNYLMVPTKRQGFLYYCINTDNTINKKRSGYFPPQLEKNTIAAGYIRGKFFLLHQDMEGIYLRKSDKKKKTGSFFRIGKPGSISLPDRSVSPLYQLKNSNKILFLDGRKDAYYLPFDRDIDISTFFPVAYECSDHTFIANKILLIGRLLPEEQPGLLSLDKQTCRIELIKSLAAKKTVLSKGQRGFIILGVNMAGNDWDLYKININTTSVANKMQTCIIKMGQVSIPDDKTVVGLEMFNNALIFLVLSRDRQNLELIQPLQPVRLLISEKMPIRSVSDISSILYSIAWTTDDGIITIYNIYNQKILKLNAGEDIESFH
jgi:hypothetical protein